MIAAIITSTVVISTVYAIAYTVRKDIDEMDNR